MMTKQEKKVQLDALAKEIESHEIAIKNWREDLGDAELREDTDEVRRLTGNIRKSERTIEIAKEQIGILAPDVQTKSDRARTSEQTRGKGRQGAKAS